MQKTFKSGNQWLTKGLFLETNYMAQDQVVYTLKDQDDDSRGLPSLYRLYMLEEDLTEWEFATKHLGGWEHWELISKSAWFKPYVSRWRKELELKIKARALKELVTMALAGGKQGFAANRFLVEKGWVERPEGKRGRPTKQEIQQELNQKELSEDFERMQIN